MLTSLRRAPRAHAEILQALKSIVTTDEAIELQRECSTRREWLKARLAQIDRPASLAIPLPAERERAMQLGVEAVDKLDAEVRSIVNELAMSDRVEAQCVAASNRIVTERCRGALPKIASAMPAKLDAVEAALDALDAAVAAMNAAMADLGHFGEEGVDLPFPLAPEVLSRTYALRERLWTRGSFVALQPPWSEYYSDSIALAFTTRYGVGGLHWSRRTDVGAPRADARRLLEGLDRDGLKVEFIQAA